MTTTTATAKLRFIPAEGYRTTVGNVEIRSHFVNGAGWTVQIRRNGAFESAQMHAHEHLAVDAINTLLAELETLAEAEQPTEAPAPVVKLPAAAKGTQTKVSDPGHTALAIAASNDEGIVKQGGGLGEATRPQIRSLAKRGYLIEIYETDRSDARKVIEAGRITAKGLARLADLTKAEREAAEKAARLAVIDTIQIAA